MRALKVKIFFSLILTSIILFGYVQFKSINGYSDFEKMIWGHLYLFNNQSINVYDYFLAQTPIAFFNLSLIYGLLNFKLTIQSLFFMSLLGFMIFFISNKNLEYQIFTRKKWFHCLLFLLLIVNPNSLTLIYSNPLWLLIIPNLFLFLNGVRLFNQAGFARGILLSATSLAVLLLLGNYGVILLISLMIFFPLFFKDKLVMQHPLAIYWTYLFPSIAVIASLYYLAWLNQKPLLDVLFYSQPASMQNDLSGFWFVLPLAAYSLLVVPEKLIERIYNSLAYLVLLAYFYSLWLFNSALSPEMSIGLISLVAGIDFFYYFNDKKRYLIKLIYILVLGLVVGIDSNSFQRHKITETEYAQELNHLHTWLEANSKLNSALVTPHYQKVLQGLREFDHLVTPNTLEFNQVLNQRFNQFERLVVEYTPNSLQLSFLQEIQRALFFNGHPEFQLVFSGNYFRIYQRPNLPFRQVSRSGENQVRSQLLEHFLHEFWFFILLFYTYIMVNIILSRKRNEN